MPRSLAIALILALAACSDPATTEAPEAFGRLVDEDRAPQTILKEYATGVTTPVSGLISSATEWRRLWGAIHATRQPQPPLPAVDFDREALLYVGLGNTANGATPLIERVDVYERGAVAQLTIEVPSPTCLILTAIFQPVHVVRIAKPGARALRVDRHEVTRDCR